VPPLLTIVPMPMPPDSTSSSPPDRTVSPLSVCPDRMSYTCPLLTTTLTLTSSSGLDCHLKCAASRRHARFFTAARGDFASALLFSADTPVRKTQPFACHPPRTPSARPRNRPFRYRYLDLNCELCPFDFGGSRGSRGKCS